ncbi:LacI family DNA-binding transcriptional regulator [Marinilabilia salmonicolor]|uniref:LacI family DNA-binding transcriptional regulator n=1 Tax=Marinilabilia salmonicolor TaxID=989 RepID=UPI00029B24FA|nr:LacI family DNA-binding transcriptional regulator [Marinilabilia salmonicolor]
MVKKRVTITDIALEMGITPSTVSRALAGNQRVRVDTRERVLNVAAKMGYQPNVLASSLRSGRSDTIGMVVPRINRHFFSHVISGVEAVLNPAGYNLLISQTHERQEHEIKAFSTLLRNRVAGIIVSHSVETQTFEHFRQIIDEEISLVQFDRVTEQVPGPRIVNDNFLGALRSTQHLIKNGCRRIAHFAGALHVNVYEQRLDGYRYALEQAGIDVDPALIVENCIVQEAGMEAVENVIVPQQVDGIFAASDLSALGAIRTLKELNIAIPEKVKISGFANEPFAEMIDPTLTSVEQNAFEMGNQAARSMIESLGKEDPVSEEIHIPVRLIQRRSSVLNNSI